MMRRKIEDGIQQLMNFARLHSTVNVEVPEHRCSFLNFVTKDKDGLNLHLREVNYHWTFLFINFPVLNCWYEMSFFKKFDIFVMVHQCNAVHRSNGKIPFQRKYSDLTRVFYSAWLRWIMTNCISMERGKKSWFIAMDLEMFEKLLLFHLYHHQHHHTGALHILF